MILGVISGYEINVYTDSTRSTIFKTYTVAATALTKTLTVASDLKRGSLNYVGIKAYYTKPNGSGKLYGPELTSKLVLPIGALSTPTINYPITNTTWHNKNFRVLVTLPTDDDYSQYDSSTQTNYVYKDIELNINGTAYKYSSYPNIFSISSLKAYQAKICINPSLISGFPNKDSYEITVRVQKNYYSNIWSNYSSKVILNRSTISNLTLTEGNKVLASEYTTLRDYSLRLRNVYPIKTLQANNVANSKGSIIYHKHYKAIYDTILDIQSGVNGWARFDTGKDNTKFNQTINILSGANAPTQDFITDAKDERPTVSGRNYINIIIDAMNQLY